MTSASCVPFVHSPASQNTKHSTHRDGHSVGGGGTSHQPSAPIPCCAWCRRWLVWLVWWLVVVFHLVNCVFLLIVSQLYAFLELPEAIEITSMLRIPDWSMSWSYWAYLLLAACHAIAVFRMTAHSLRRRMLAFPGYDTAPPTDTTATRQSRLLRAVRAAWTHLERAWAHVFGPSGMFGLRGKLFDVAFAFREATEILMQTYQAYLISRAVPREWINLFAVSAIVLNCVSTPLLHAVIRRDIRLRRLCCLLMDAALDFCGAVMIPICVAWPYVMAYDPVLGGFPPELMNSDEWFINAVAEVRQLLIQSQPDFVSTLLPHVSIVSCLSTLKNFVQDPHAHVPIHRARVVAIAPAVPPRSLRASSSLRRYTSFARIPTYSEVSRHWSSAIHLLFLAWAAFVVAQHQHAQQNEILLGCAPHVNAWFTSKASCSAMNVNCYRYNISGSSHELTSVLARLQRDALTSLVFSHCPALHVPRIITEFTVLQGLELYNATLVDWPADLAIRAAAFTQLNFMFIVRSNLAEFPKALLHDDLPPDFRFLELYETNLTALPEQLGSSWRNHHWMCLGFESGQLELVPDTALRGISADLLKLNGNKLRSVPADLGLASVSGILDVSHNPLDALLLSVHDQAALSAVYAESTQISKDPAWLRPAFEDAPRRSRRLTVSFLDAPLCSSGREATHSALATADAALLAWICPQASLSAAVAYPVEVTEPFRGL